MRWSLHRALLAAALACPAAGCGRLGFDFMSEPSEISVSEAGVGVGDAGVSSSDAAVDPVAKKDAGVAPSDAAVAMSDASIVMRDGAVPMDASGATEDARPIASDAGAEVDARVPAPGFCAAFEQALFCSDFSVRPSPIELKERGGRLSFASGTLSATTFEPGGVASIAANFAPVHEGTLYARFRLRVPRTSQVTAINVFAFTQSVDDDIHEINMNMLAADRFDFFALDTNARFISGPAAFARDDFQCVEVMLEVDDYQGRARIEVDGVAVLVAGPFDTTLAGGIGRFALGMDYTGLDQPATAIEIDDFVLAREELAGCP